MDMLRAGARNAPTTYKPLVDIATDMAKMGVEAGWGLMFGADEPAKPRGKRAPRMGRGKGGKSILPKFAPADNNLGRLLDPAGLQQSLMAAYQTDNPIHAQIFDSLRDEPIENTLNKAYFLKLLGYLFQLALNIARRLADETANTLSISGRSDDFTLFQFWSSMPPISFNSFSISEIDLIALFDRYL